MKKIQLGNIRIAYTQAGHGPPLVLLHGGMEDNRSWRQQIDSLSDEFTVFAWDAPGCGQSSDVPESWRMSNYADALAGWLNKITLKRSHLLGLSWGSSLALEFYHRYPNIPLSLILASAYAGWKGSLPPDEVATRLENILASVNLPLEEVVESWLSVLNRPLPGELIHELTTIWGDNSGRSHPGGFRATAYSMAEADLRDVLPQIQIPTLLLYGELDQRSPLKVANDLLRLIPLAKLTIIPQAGHLANAEAPEEFNRHVRCFLRSVSGYG
jgi:pimeloyl-ACP methyl ester carboxylesterase